MRTFAETKFMEILHIASGTLTLFFIVLLLSKKKKSVADQILGIWFGVILINIITFYLLSRNDMRFGLILELSDSSAYLHAPLFWFYTLSLTRPSFYFKIRDVWHFLPFLLSASLFIPNLYFQFYNLEGIRIIGVAVKLIQIPIYILAGLILLKRHQTQLPHLFSSTQKITLSWLHLFAWSLLIIWFISAISLSLFFFAKINIPSFGGLYSNIAVSILVFILGYFGFRQTTIFMPQHLVNNSNSPSILEQLAPSEEVLSSSLRPVSSNTSSEKYAKSGLNPTTADGAYQSLLQMMEQQRPYLNPQLNLYGLAELLDLPPNHLSQVINAYANQNFFDFVNQYRVEAVKEKLAAKAHLQHTLLGIAFDCGFNSKSSFNRAFKKFTGKTPTAYLKIDNNQGSDAFKVSDL